MIVVTNISCSLCMLSSSSGIFGTVELLPISTFHGTPTQKMLTPLTKSIDAISLYPGEEAFSLLVRFLFLFVWNTICCVFFLLFHQNQNIGWILCTQRFLSTRFLTFLVAIFLRGLVLYAFWFRFTCTFISLSFCFLPCALICVVSNQSNEMLSSLKCVSLENLINKISTTWSKASRPSRKSYSVGNNNCICNLRTRNEIWTVNRKCWETVTKLSCISLVM